MIIPDYFLPACICVITGKEVGKLDYSFFFLNTNEGEKLFQVWLDPKISTLQASEKRKLVQETLGNPINLKQL